MSDQLTIDFTPKPEPLLWWKTVDAMKFCRYCGERVNSGNGWITVGMCKNCEEIWKADIASGFKQNRLRQIMVDRGGGKPMNTQPVLFEVEKQIPQWIADYFELANAGSYLHKQSFYNTVKPRVLKTFGQFAGYDLQIIEKKCWSCNGTGIFKHYSYDFSQRYLIGQEPCWKCIGGIYETIKIPLERYILNGRVYHIPLGESREGFYPFKNEIKGIIVHKPVEPDQALRAYIILLWMYNKTEFYNYLTAFAATEIINKTSWIRPLLQSLFKRDNTKYELPF